jgi:HEAT repeat protein
MSRLLALTPLLFAACSSSPEIRREAAPDVVAHEEKMREEDAKRRDFNAVLVRLDQAIDSYVQALFSQGGYGADTQAERLEKLIRETVLDTGPSLVGRTTPVKPGETYARLQAAATDASNPNFQRIALGALGFSGMAQAMPTLLQGVQLSDEYVQDAAALGLGVLREPSTPIGPLAAIVSDPKHSTDGRVNAAWAIYCIQTAAREHGTFVQAWVRFLTELRDNVPDGVHVQALRGLGLARDTAHADLVASFLKSPLARKRMTAALALGRMNAQTHWAQLLELLGPQEVVQNVRLTARKALAELAGGNDYGYDVTAWRKAFDRGR